MSDTNLIARIEAATVDNPDLPYAQIAMALARMGFQMVGLYIDGKAVDFANAAGIYGQTRIVQALGPDAVIWWSDDKGNKVIQCGALDSGPNGEPTSMVFAPIAAPDITSQLAALTERFSVLADDGLGGITERAGQ